MDEARSQRLSEFTAWVSQYITGDEKGQAQIFLDRLFQGFARPGCLDVGGTPEFRVRKPQEDGGGTAFADYVWKPVVLIEMKKRGEDLKHHYRQAFDYWTRLVPGRPRWVVLCNFDEFWVYDFETQMDTPVDRVSLAELPVRYGPLAFLFPTNEKPVFGNDHEAVTRKAADMLARCFNKLLIRKVPREEAQRFILQMLVALFAEDIDLLERYLVTRLLEECTEPRLSYDLLGGLFAEMNTPGKTPGGRFKGVDYFNGGLFAHPARIELMEDEVAILREASTSNWSKVRPEIFGTIFEHSLGAVERHAFGAHFTHPTDIMKIVGPTIVDPWRERIAAVKNRDQMGALIRRMQHFKVLDPACGSGNFLYLAYREMKRLEAHALERANELARRRPSTKPSLGFVKVTNFYGMDINPFAVELAKVTMMIARKLAIDEMHSVDRPLPLDNLDANFIAGDALMDAEGNTAPWPKADVIIGNPPFLGAKRLKPERGPDYVNAVRRAFPEVPGMADYCVYWFRRAHDLLPPCTADDPVAGRAGLVGTQNVRNNQSRVGGLDAVVKDGTIIEAVNNQPWSGEANVHVSIVNWVKTQDPKLLPKTRRLWSKAEPHPGPKKPRRHGAGPASKEYELAYRDVAFINSALSDQADVAGAKVLECNTRPQRVFQGQVTGHEAFVLTPGEAHHLIRMDPSNAEVIHPLLIGRDLVTGKGQPGRHVIDFLGMDQLKASSFSEPFKRLQEQVLPDRTRKAAEGKGENGELRPHHQLFLRYWWRQSYDRGELISAIEKLPRFVVCSRVTKRPIFCFLDSTIRPDGQLMAFTFADDYSFGILQSHAHWIWFITKCSKLKSDFRYTPPSVFDTFPWPQSPTDPQVEAIAAAGREIRRIRAEALAYHRTSLRALYRTLELPGKNPLKDAHAALDAAVLDAYGFDAKGDLLAQILALNLAIARRIEQGQPVTAPGVPPSSPNPANLITNDCIQPPATP